MKKKLRTKQLILIGLTLISGMAFFSSCSDDKVIEPNLELIGAGSSIPNQSRLKAGVDPGIADASINAYNNAFLVNSGGNTYYKKALNDNGSDGTWTLALDIQGMEDAYERSGNIAHKTIVNDLCNSFLRLNPPPYSWDGWNDDIAWMGLALIRGYQMTGTANFLTQARYCFDFVWSRGWDTQYNAGGIWEQQPNMTPAGGAVNKCALSNNPTGKLACMIYQSTGDVWYKDRAQQIYDWSWSHLFDPNTGQVYASIDRNNYVDKSTAVYNQGSFVDFAALLYKITGNDNILRDAQRAADYVKNNMTTNGIISNTAGYLNTWADEYARGLGHLCMWNPQLWNTYYSFMQNNANAAWNCRRTDLNIAWNGWTQTTPVDASGYPSRYVSAVAMIQFAPVINPTGGSLPNGTYKIINRASGKALDAKGGGTINGTAVVQWGYNGGNNQRWTLTSLGNGQYKLTNVASGRSLDVSAGSTVPGTAALLWDYYGGANQKFSLGSAANGYYTLFFQHDYQVLDVSGGSLVDGATVLQWGYNGGNNQQWQFVAL